MPLNAEIVTTGTEILLGEIVDTNAAWIAQQLRDVGVNLFYKTTVGDNLARIRGVIELCMSRSDVIICSGGLGPTVDDMTRHAIAEATGRPLQMHEPSRRKLEERFVRLGVQMTENNYVQALIPEGAIVIDNPVGTAPGFIVETQQSTVIAVPGVPREMKALMTETILPYLRQRGGEGIIRRRVLRTIGIGESLIDTKLDDLLRQSNPTVGLAAKTGQVDVRIAARALTVAEVEAMLDELEREVRNRIGEFIYTDTPEESYEAVIVKRLQSQGATLAISENNTRGTLADRLRQALPSFDPLQNAVLDDTIAVSEAAVREAAQQLQRRSAATYALVISGTAGADEGVWGAKNGETWASLADSKTVITTRINFGGQDEYTLVRIGNGALALLDRATKLERV
ncbi:MAG: CinA family nicotinamide mononucleotide deamidase-related protein [Caldilineaceae bacterium]